ncbi:hypothetical protein CP061683_1448A, partial [Chlamydia psittaci 06-1683]
MYTTQSSGERIILCPP